MAELHFVGVGGAGMSCLAEVYARRGHLVSGCDLRDGPTTARLRAMGVQVWIGHDPCHVRPGSRVVASRAVPATEPELVAARQRGIQVVHRAQLLAELVAGESDSVGIAGTHGKTTTTALLAVALEAAGLDPTALVGGEVREFGGGARVGSGPAVVEVDESDGSLVLVRVHSAIITPLDLTDHVDHYPSLDTLIGTFARFLGGLKRDGVAVLCADSPNTRALQDKTVARVVTYGTEGGIYRGRIIEQKGIWSRFVLERAGHPAGEVVLRLPGRHNVANATGALALALEWGARFEAVAEAFARFSGVRRRFEVYCEAPLVVDDYAHNPVKVRSVLRALREAWPHRRIVAVFQPHRYSRTRTTYWQYADSFADADQVIVTELYPADEPPEPGVSGRWIADALRHPSVRWLPELEAVVPFLMSTVRPQDVVATLGAGDVWKVAQRLTQELGA